MYENDISKMDFKGLKERILLLGDELATIKRRYEEIIDEYLDYSGLRQTLRNSYGISANNSDSSIKLQLGSAAGKNGEQGLNIEKYDDEIRIGTYVSSSDSELTDFAGITIKPSTGEVTLTGKIKAVAVFG